MKLFKVEYWESDKSRSAAWKNVAYVGAEDMATVIAKYPEAYEISLVTSEVVILDRKANWVDQFKAELICNFQEPEKP